MYQVKTGEMEMVLKKIKDFYLSALVKEDNLEKRLENVVSGMINMLGDANFNYPIDRMVKLQGNKEHSPVWVYQYNYKHNHSLANFDPVTPGQVFYQHHCLNNFHSFFIFQVRKVTLKQLEKATHAHELSMLFPAFEDVMGPLSEEETKNSRKFVKFIVEFMKRGHPKQDGKYEFKEWEPVANGQLSYFTMGKYSATQKGLPHQHRMKWWNELPVYWRKNPEDVTEDEKYTVGEVEELTKEELEELEANLVLEQMKIKEEL